MPNPVQSLGTSVSKEVLKKEIEIAAISLNKRKMNSDVAMIKSLIEEISPDYQTSQIGENFERRVELLQSSIITLKSRAVRIGNADIVGLCELTGNIVTDIKERPIPPNLRHLLVMPKLVLGFKSAMLTGGGKSGSA